MLQSNRIMQGKLSIIGNDQRTIDRELLELLASGFTVIDQCVFLSSLVKLNKNAKIDDFPDRTGFECYVNSVHVDDFVQSNDLEQSILFISEVFAAWNNTMHNGVIRAIISNNEFGTVVKLHLIRENESWLSANIEEYDEAIFVVDSTDVNQLRDGFAISN
jgi:hypothetical protein